MLLSMCLLELKKHMLLSPISNNFSTFVNIRLTESAWQQNKAFILSQNDIMTSMEGLLMLTIKRAFILGR